MSCPRTWRRRSPQTRKRWRPGRTSRRSRGMNGSAGSSRPRRRKRERAASNGAVPTSGTESADPVVGLAVRIGEIIANAKRKPSPLPFFTPRGEFCPRSLPLRTRPARRLERTFATLGRRRQSRALPQPLGSCLAAWRRRWRCPPHTAKRRGYSQNFRSTRCPHSRTVDRLSRKNSAAASPRKKVALHQRKMPKNIIGGIF